MLDFIEKFRNRMQQKKEEEKDNAILLDSPVPDFIPYACHYNKNTVLTKNGELLQTIKIEGFAYKELSNVQSDMRKTIQGIVNKYINSNQFALYFHTMRKERKLDTSPEYPEIFAQSMHDSWVKINNWDKKFINELHITIVHSGMPIKLGYKNLFQSLFIDSLLNKHDKFLNKASEEINIIADKILESLSGYGAIKLTAQHNNSTGYYSEILSFFTSIIHLEEQKIPMPIADLSKFLAKYKIAFGNNALEVKRDQDKFFATILSIKKFAHVSFREIDEFLQLPIKFVITQTVNFVPRKQALEPYNRQNYIMNVSKDKEFQTISGLHKMYSKDNNKNNAEFCSSQLTIMIIESELKNLEKSMKIIRERLSKIGIVSVREDINMENCFWSQLPGNFNFITRKNFMLSSDVGSFSSLYNFPFGSLASKWGAPITLFNTISGTPYFFNFHVENNGHTIIVGEDGSGKSTLLSFLLSESLKFKPNTLYLDSDNRSEIFIKALGGKYSNFSFEPKEKFKYLKLNPLSLPDNPETREFLKYWFIFLLDKYSDPTDIDEYLEIIAEAVEVIFTIPKEKRKLGNIKLFFKNSTHSKKNQSIFKQLSMWYGNGKFAHIFDNEQDDLINESNNKLFAIDMTSIYDTPIGINLPILSHILFCFKHFYTSKNPSILAVDNGNRLFNSIYFEKNLEYILQDLQDNNAILLTHASFSSEKVNWSSTVGNIYNKSMATKIFLADGSAYKNILEIFDFSKNEKIYLHALDKNSRQFLIKQHNSSVIATMDLTDTQEIKILACTRHNNKLAQEKIMQYGSDPRKWLFAFYQDAI